MRPVTIPSRDGLALHSYLTLPVGVEPDKLPLVLVVHGGPWYRDSWGFDAGVQMLANRGYAVLQVNFRGSTGYGKAFLKAAIGEFAGKMHDDLIDGVNWAVEQGYADPDRVAIFGGSYGGYATLVGVTVTPDVSPPPSTTSVSPIWPTSCGRCPRSRGLIWPTTGMPMSGIPTIPISWPTCESVHRSPWSTRSAPRCW